MRASIKRDARFTMRRTYQKLHIAISISVLSNKLCAVERADPGLCMSSGVEFGA